MAAGLCRLSVTGFSLVLGAFFFLAVNCLHVHSPIFHQSNMLVTDNNLRNRRPPPPGEV